LCREKMDLREATVGLVSAALGFAGGLLTNLLKTVMPSYTEAQEIIRAQRAEIEDLQVNLADKEETIQVLEDQIRKGPGR
jgi:hypothetical protein